MSHRKPGKHANPINYRHDRLSSNTLVWCYSSIHRRLGIEMTVTNPLSPAAQAVRDAFWKDLDFREDFTPNNIAAALRAAADQVVPPALEEEFIDRNQALPLTKMVEIRRHLYAIAAELEGQ